MNCNKAKKSHLTYWEQSPARQKELEAHLQDCPSCRHSFQQLSSAIQIFQKTLRPVEKPEDFAPYWHRLSRHLVRPGWPERIGEQIKSIAGLINRSILGPVPAYAVAGVVVMAILVIIPLTRSSKSLLSSASHFRSNLVVEQFEPNWANTQDGLTVYTLAQNTTPGPVSSTTPR